MKLILVQKLKMIELLEYDRFVKDLLIALDASRNIAYDDFVENRSIYSGSFFEINVKSYKKDIFRSLENGLNSTFTNTYSLRKWKKEIL